MSQLFFIKQPSLYDRKLSSYDIFHRCHHVKVIEIIFLFFFFSIRTPFDINKQTKLFLKKKDLQKISKSIIVARTISLSYLYTEHLLPSFSQLERRKGCLQYHE